MSKKHYSRNSDGAVKITAIVALFLALIVGAYVVLSLVYKTWNPVNWTGTNQEQTDNDGNSGDNSDNNDNAGNVIVTPDNNNGEVLLTSVPLTVKTEDGTERVVPDSYVLTASANVNDVSLMRFKWTYDFENASSAWAVGKNVNDYGTFTLSTDTTQLTFQTKQAFGEPIIITATSTINTEAFNTCKVDYIKRVTSVTFDVNKNGSNPHLFELGKSNSFDLNTEYGIGTVTGEITVSTVSAKVNETLLGYMRIAMHGIIGQADCNKTVTFEPHENIRPSDFFTGRGDAQYLPDGQLGYNAMLEHDSQNNEVMNDCWLIINVTYTYTFNENEVQTGTTENQNIKYSSGGLVPYEVVTSVELDKTHIYV